MRDLYKIFGGVMAALLIGVILYAIFWGGEAGTYFVLFLIGAGLFGGGARRRTATPSPFDEENDGTLSPHHKMTHDPIYANFPGNTHHPSYMQNRRK